MIAPRVTSRRPGIAPPGSLTMVLLLLFAFPARAEYRIGWHSIGAGAGRVSGLTNSRINPVPVGIVGGPGQPLSAKSAGGPYSLQGGFWVAGGTTYLVDVPAPGVTPPAGANVLRAPRPNPFTVGTSLTFELARPGPAELRVFDTSGRFVRTLAEGWYEAGAHSVAWDGRREDRTPAAAGLYFARFTGPGGPITRRLILLR